jgi:hypothetical protein
VLLLEGGIYYFPFDFLTLDKINIFVHRIWRVVKCVQNLKLATCSFKKAARAGQKKKTEGSFMLGNMPRVLPEEEIAPARLIAEIIIQLQGRRGSIPQTCVPHACGSNDDSLILRHV